MTRLLDRYILRQFTFTFVTLVTGLPLLFIIADITDNIDSYMDRGIAIRSLALSYVYQFPLFVLYAFPIAALVATVFTIGGMTRHQEITAAKAGGISFYRIFLPIGILSVVLAAGALALGELVPVTLRKRAELITPGYATAKAPGMHLLARRAVWRSRGGWRLEDGWKRELRADGTEKATRFDTLGVPGLVETPEELLAEPREPEEMRYAEMTRFIGAIERSGGDARPLRVERAQKLAIPMAVVVIVLFGAPLVTSSQRGGTAYGVGVSLGITIVYMLLFRVGKALGSSGAIDPLIAAWGPNAILLVAGLVLMARVRT
jgi:lipopolysaccharide export system permease protein